MITPDRTGCHFKRRLLLLGMLVGSGWAMATGTQQPLVTPTATPALPRYIDPQEIRRGLPMGGVEGRSRRQLYYERLVQKVQPDLEGDPERLPQYIELFKREMVNDTRLFPVEVEAEWEEGTVRLTGFVGFEEHRETLLALLRFLGFEKVDDRIETLPSSQLGELLFSFVKVPHCFTYGRPTGRREPMTDCLLGDPVYLLKAAEEGHFLCHSSEGYLGYIDGQCLRRVNAEEFARYQNGPQVYLLEDCEAEELYVPAGARLKWLRDAPDAVVAELPTGEEIALPRGRVEVRPNVSGEAIEQVIQIASQMLGTKYVWSGKTAKGVDCSGLIQTAFKAKGINLPRDAYQQAYLGSLVATRWYRDGLRRGDTLYFIGRNGTINHTALYVGEGRYLEASGPDVHYSSFNPDHEEYHERKARSFCFAKRLLE